MRPRIFFFGPNYFNSYGGFLFLALIVFYIIFINIFSIYDIKFSSQLALIEYIKEQYKKGDRVLEIKR